MSEKKYTTFRDLKVLPTLVKATIEPDSIVPNSTLELRSIESQTIEPLKALPANDSPVEPDSIELYSIVPKQFTPFPNGILDNLLRTLPVYDQIILIRLYRLSRGFHQETCKVSYLTLASACNMTDRQAQKCVARLIARQLIKIVERDLSSSVKSERGNVYLVKLPPATIAQRSTVERGSIERPSDNKVKAVKENNKSELKFCPRCEPLNGFYYPEGQGKGIAKCDHRLSKS